MDKCAHNEMAGSQFPPPPHFGFDGADVAERGSAAHVSGAEDGSAAHREPSLVLISGKEADFS